MFSMEIVNCVYSTHIFYVYHIFYVERNGIHKSSAHLFIKYEPLMVQVALTPYFDHIRYTFQEIESFCHYYLINYSRH